MALTIYGDNYVPHTEGVIEIPFWLGLAVFTFIWFAARALICLRRKIIDKKHEAKMLLMYINLALLFRLTLFPLGSFGIRVDPLRIDTQGIFPPSINITPFSEMFAFIDPVDSIRNFFGNILMFVPTGILFPVIYKKLRSLAKTVLAGALISLCIEVLQLPLSDRISDIDDIILNTAGVALGYGIYALLRRIKTKA